MVFRLRLVSAGFAVLLFGSVQAQPVRVAGVVADAETGLPLEGTNVFVSGTTLRSATDSLGRFSLVLDAPATVTLVASRVGFETQTRRLVLRPGGEPGGEVSLALALVPAVQALGSVEITADDAQRWQRAFNLFRIVFLGGTLNASRAEILNAKAVRPEIRRDGGVDATARAPFSVRNDALGYTLTFDDFAFSATSTGLAWDATVVFDDLCPAAGCPAATVQARDAAYRGSVAHFLMALRAGRLAEEGFDAETVSRAGASRSLGDVVWRLFGSRRERAGSKIEVRTTATGWEVDIDGALRVTYAGEHDARPGGRGPQASWLTVQDGVLRFGADGSVQNPTQVIRSGYWDWERVADLLPTDYRPQP